MNRIMIRLGSMDVRNNEFHIIDKDIVVIGGGLAGICAAIAATRHGEKVALVQDRPVLGGNSSSEIRVWIVGATAMGNNRYANETGIIGEIEMENLYKNPEGNPHLWDTILLDFVKRENNVELFLNTHVASVNVEENTIKSVSGFQLGTEKLLEFKATVFIDCTGDGTVGYLAGAEYMQGRENRKIFNESLAAEVDDKYTLGNTMFFYVKDAGKKVKYIPPLFAYPREKIKEILNTNDKHIEVRKAGCDLWWLEYGGILDTIHDNEIIKEELQRLIYGIWDYIKNSGEFDAENLTLDWVGSIPGKRESRRFKGDYILNQNDLIEQREFNDAVCYGGWPVDVHPEKGIYTKSDSCHQTPVGVYQIPLRSLYSCNINNLMFAGRNISVSHIAFASTRVMKTCALIGQTVGTAASMAFKREKW